MRLAAIYADTAKDKWRLHIVRGTGLGICGVLLAAAVFRAEDWYLVTNAFFGPRIADQRVGILLAPYNNDPKDTARGRLRADLRQLLDSTPELAAEAQILPLPRPIPGYHPEEPAEQAEAAQLIGAYNRAGAVVYGAAVGEQTGYLVNTQVKLINPPAFLAESLTVSRVDLNPPTNDARFVHLEAAMVAASTALTSDRCGIAEHLFDEAAAARRDIPDAVPTKKDNDLLSVSDIAYWIAMSIDCQLASGVSVSPESVARALRLLDAIPSDPKSTADMRVRALSEQAYIHRHLAERRTNIDDVKQELKLAIDAYTRALEAAPKDHAGIFVAAAQNSRGVTRVELEKHIDRRDEAGRRALLAGARQDYDAANSTLRRPVARERAASRSDRLHLGTTVGINQAVVVFRLGTLENNPDRIEEAIRLYTGLLSDVAETPRLETTLRNNLGDAYFVLAGYHDAPANYRAARVELEHGLAASGNAEPLVSTDLISKIGYVNISLGRIGADPAGQRRGIAALGCAYRLSRAAGLNRQADSILAGLGEEQRRLAPVIYSDALHSSTPYRVCQAT
jgi:tetratricopeptide (TPR) repeat protein